MIDLKMAVANGRMASTAFTQYCTEKCMNCPISRACEEGVIDFKDSIFDDKSVIDRYIRYYEKCEDEAAHQQFYEATGTDPYWYRYNEDRSYEEI